MTVVAGPDEAAFREDLLVAEFAAGEVQMQWGLASISWPHVVVWIAAAPRPQSPDRYWFRLNCAGYPGRGPTGSLWNCDQNALLEHRAWPKGRARFAHVFRTDWESGMALYHPYDGHALKTHGNWPAKYPGKLWSRDRNIADWLAEFHDLLNCDEYEGVRACGAAS
ncbi:MAG: hypothetical protein CMJ58_00300 [Planctomycetaceae bacterium]|nr:hypothetical protein [Planctomycetaceae bacterium]